MLGYEQVGMYSREYRYFREYPSLDPVPPNEPMVNSLTVTELWMESRGNILGGK